MTSPSTRPPVFSTPTARIFAIIAAADALRARTVGDVVTYVINRNINFTNVCIKACGFCAFSRGHLAEEGYFLPVEEVYPARQRSPGAGRDRSRAYKRASRRASMAGITSISAAL